MTPDTYEGSLEQAELACIGKIANLLELEVGRDATVATTNGLPDAAMFDIGALGVGETTGFSSDVHHFVGTLELYNRDRPTLQRWIMRLIAALPCNRWRNALDEVRTDANVVHLRISPENGSISKITSQVVSSSNSGDVPTWTCKIAMDVVFVCNPDCQLDEGNADGGGIGGETGGDDPLPED